MGTDTDVAINSAQVTLVKGDLRGIVQPRLISEKTVANMTQTLGFAFLYNSLGVPLAAGVHIRLRVLTDDRGARHEFKLRVGHHQRP